MVEMAAQAAEIAVYSSAVICPLYSLNSQSKHNNVVDSINISVILM